jgi:CRISPR-associated protein Cas1
MKRLLNTLYVTTQGTYLAREGDAVLVRTDTETKLRVPIHTIGGIVCFGRVSCSPSLMGLCGRNNVSIAHLTENGRFLARIQGPVSGNVVLRREQYRKADDESFCAGVARSVVLAKIANSRTSLLRAAREKPALGGMSEMKRAIGYLGRLVSALDSQTCTEAIRGKEGEAARTYFGVMGHLISAQRESFFMAERSRRPPLDNFNALLSFLYTLLAMDATSALEAVGLDPQVGYFHRERPGRNSLALDIMEELRAYLVDRLVLTLVNRRQIKAKGFRRTESGAVMMDDKTRKEVIVAYQKRKRDTITHPFLEERIQIGLLLHAQAMLLARHIRGDLDAYPSFIWK